MKTFRVLWETLSSQQLEQVVLNHQMKYHVIQLASVLFQNIIMQLIVLLLEVLATALVKQVIAGEGQNAP